MHNFKKALSVFLCAVMMFTTLCFFPVISEVTSAQAAVVNDSKDVAFYVPEVIYLYPDVTSWTESVKTPFQYFVGNTVNLSNIYSTPIADANLNKTGKVYFADKGGFSNVSLSYAFVRKDGSAFDAASDGTLVYDAVNKGSYYDIDILSGVSPELASSESGCFIKWTLTYTAATGEKKACIAYTYVYKPYVIPYGGAARVYNEKDDVNVFGQHITWVTGVHSIDYSAAAKNTLYPYYITVSSSNSSKFAFSPFISKENKAYVGGVEVSGGATVMNGTYYPVFAGLNSSVAYFYAGQEGASLNAKGNGVKTWFYTASSSETYPYGSFDYMNNVTVSTAYALSQVTPTKLGSIYVDTSRYDNLNEVPNLGVGMMITDTNVADGITTNTPYATALWYIGDATDFTHPATSAYDTESAMNSARDNAGTFFASAQDITAPITSGIVYAGTWNRAIDNKNGNKTYTVKGYYEARDREGDRQAASASVGLNVIGADKSVLRTAVDRAVSYFSVLGLKENNGSYYYDSRSSAWADFISAYETAAKALCELDVAVDCDKLADDLNNALDTLLSGKGMRVYFDVNHDNIGINLFVKPSTSYYKWDSQNETVVINGNFYQEAYFGVAPFTPDAGSYTMTATHVSGTFNGNGGIVLEAVNKDSDIVTKTDGTGYSFEISGSDTQVIAFEQANFINTDGMKFFARYDGAAGDGVYNNYALRIKIEKGTQQTEYSPAGKVLTGSTYGTLPTPTREGYLFAGWYTDASYTQKVDESSAVSARILYAKWDNAQYNIVFDANGATSGEMPEQTVSYDIKTKLNANAYEKTGYVFSHWTDDDGNIYADGSEVLNLTSTHQGKYTLYANWTPNQYTVAFDGNTGLGGIGILNGVYDLEFNLPANYFIKTGYTFIGWSTSPDGEVIYTDGEEVVNLTSEVNGSVTLYAVWNVNTFTVKFDGNTGNGTMADREVVYDSNVLLPDCEFTKTGYTFMGWSLSADSKTLVTDLEYDNLCTEEGDSITLYAVWAENSYTLKFDMNGGTGAAIQPTVYGYEEVVALPKNVFSKTGYILAGWSLTKDGEKVYENGETVSHICSDNNGTVILYAIWTPVSYTVRFNNNSGAGEMADITLSYDESAVLPGNVFTREGYHFLGWATKAQGAVEIDDKEDVINLANTDNAVVTLYAVWEINTYTVTFVFKKNNVGVSVPVKVNHGEKALVPSDFENYDYFNTSTHSVFSKWDKDFSNVTSDMTVTASYSSTTEAHSMKTQVFDSTCYSVGKTVHFCEKCSYSYEVPIGMKSHSWDEGSVGKEPGCVTAGETVYRCKNDGCTQTTVTPIAPVGHDFVPFAAKEPSCSEQGNIAHKHCERCEKCFASDAAEDAPDSEVLSDEQVKIPKLPHTPGAEATCTTAQRCTVCTEVIVDATGHEEVITYITETASCQTAGDYIKVVSCSVCDEEISRVSATGKIPHNYENVVIEPGCESTGYTKHTCSVCGDTYNDNEVSSLGHSEGEWVVTTAPTCTEPGEATCYCLRCGEVCDTKAVSATGHTPGEWVVVTPAGCESNGSEALKCKDCSVTMSTRGISPKGHGEAQWVVSITPGCETAGLKEYKCKDCDKALDTEIIPETGHKKSGEPTCEEDSICLNCGTVLKAKLQHKWDNGTVTKEATETEKGEITYTCQNDKTHKRYEEIPLRVIIGLPQLPEDGTYDIDGDKDNKAGNIKDIIVLEAGLTVTYTSSDNKIITIDADGTVYVHGDGDAVITIKSTDGKYQKQLPVSVRVLRTVRFDMNGTIVELNAYKGDKAVPPTVESYTENSFIHTFKYWTLTNGEKTDLTVTGDVTFVALYTQPCDYTEFDRLAELFEDVISGNYENSTEIAVNRDAVNAAKDVIEFYGEDRDTRDIDMQAQLDKATKELSGLISVLYPEDNATLEIRGSNTVNAGSLVELKAYMLPLGTEVTNGIWTSSDHAVGFFSNGKFHAIKAGVVTVTVSSGNLTASFEITVNGSVAARVIMFDTLLSNTNYIVENTYIITETTNMFWAPDAPVHFRVITDGTFEEYYVYIDGYLATPDASGVYTIDANTGDIHVRVEGSVKNEEGQRVSIWEAIVNFFKKIADFFANLFK